MSKTRIALVFVFGLMAQILAAETDFILTPPAGWNQKTESSAPAHYMKGTGSLIVTIDYMPDEASTPDAYIAKAKEQLGSVFKNAAFQPVISGKHNGLDTRELIYTANVYGMSMKYDVLYIFKAGKAYTLTGGNVSDAFTDAFAADIKSFFGSFKFK